MLSERLCSSGLPNLWDCRGRNWYSYAWVRNSRTGRPERSSGRKAARRMPGDETEDGNFKLPQLPPGRYRIVFSPKIGGRVNLRQKFYWPPGNAANSGAIEIGLGQHVDNVRFEIPLSGAEK